MGSFKFGSESKIKKKADFARLQQEGRRLYAGRFLLVYRLNKLLVSRLGIAVTVKVAPNAVDRNRVKRRVREIFRLHRHLFTSQIDLLVIARNQVLGCSYEDTKREILGALTKARLMSATAETMKANNE